MKNKWSRKMEAEIIARLERIEALLATIVAALAEEDERPDDDVLVSLEGERIGGAREPGLSLG